MPTSKAMNMPTSQAWPFEFIHQLIRAAAEDSIAKLVNLKVLTVPADQFIVKVSESVDKTETMKYEALMISISELAKFSPAKLKLAEIFGVSEDRLTEEFVADKIKMEHKKVGQFLKDYERRTGEKKLEATPEAIAEEKKWANTILSSLPK